MPAPWADKHSRFTLLFECMAIEVIQACSSISAAVALLGLNWKTVHFIMDRAVQRGLKLRELEEINHVGIDEKSFGKGQSTKFEGKRTRNYWRLVTIRSKELGNYGCMR